MKLFLAQAYQGMQQNGSATAQYEQVLATKPDNIVAANNLAWNYFKTGDSRAEEVARRAHSNRPENCAFVDTLGWILVKKGALQDGIAMLRSAIELDDDRSDLRYHLAAALVAAGGTEEAKSVLQEILTTEVEFASRNQAKDLLVT
jgi:predicted Zn-dependent protease